jgi:hypothetical protein
VPRCVRRNEEHGHETDQFCHIILQRFRAIV